MADVVPHMPDGDVHAGVVMGGNRRFHLIAVHRLNDELWDRRRLRGLSGTRRAPGSALGLLTEALTMAALPR